MLQVFALVWYQDGYTVCNCRAIINSFWACHFQARTPGCKSLRVLFFMLEIYSKGISRARTPQTPQTTPQCVIDALLPHKYGRKKMKCLVHKHYLKSSSLSNPSDPHLHRLNPQTCRLFPRFKSSLSARVSENST